MLKKSLLLSYGYFLSVSAFSQTCIPGGNVAVFTNYDGGILNINCDVNIPNLKIGICTYEWCQVNIIGPFSSNVTAVRYAGFDADNNHCGYGVQPTTVTGVAAGIVTILFAPPATLPDPNGNGSIICAYQCGPGNQGGCNTSAQVAAYFTSVFSGTLYGYNTQYGCWQNETRNVSNMGCCGVVPPAGPTASFSPSSASLCNGDCVTFTNTSTGSPTSYAWTFPGGIPSSFGQSNPGPICYANPGSYTATLTVSNTNGSSQFSAAVEVTACEIPGCTYSQSVNYNVTATVDDGSCTFDNCSDCVGDLNGNGQIGFSDLTIFLGVYGTNCP